MAKELTYFKIPVTWEECGNVFVEAETVEEAITKFDKGEFEEGWELPPGDYIDGSFQRVDDDEFIKLYNTAQ